MAMSKQKVCSVTECGMLALAKSLCQKHYWRMHRHGSTNPPWKSAQKCTYDGCVKNQIAKGYCNTHYARVRRNGTLEVTRHWDGKAKERNRARVAKWKKDNWNYYKSYLANRKARVQAATPKWADKNQLIKIYKNCPNGFHVDHIVPVNHKDVCGLHVPWNLQYLSKQENLTKSNRFNGRAHIANGIPRIMGDDQGKYMTALQA